MFAAVFACPLVDASLNPDDEFQHLAMFAEPNMLATACWMWPAAMALVLMLVALHSLMRPSSAPLPRPRTAL